MSIAFLHEFQQRLQPAGEGPALETFRQVLLAALAASVVLLVLHLLRRKPPSNGLFR